MIKNKINISGKTREKSKKSNLNFEQFKEKINSTNMNISQFSKYFGISRATIYGWNLHGIPVYIERILELLETKKQLNIGINKLYEINTNENNKAKNLIRKEEKNSLNLLNITYNNHRINCCRK